MRLFSSFYYMIYSIVYKGLWKKKKKLSFSSFLVSSQINDIEFVVFWKNKRGMGTKCMLPTSFSKKIIVIIWWHYSILVIKREQSSFLLMEWGGSNLWYRCYASFLLIGWGGSNLWHWCYAYFFNVNWVMLTLCINYQQILTKKKK